MTPPGNTAILLVNLGSPDAPTPAALRRYLAEFLRDHRVVDLPRLPWWLILHGIILTTRPARSAAKYAQIWTKEGSPLKVSLGEDRTLAGFSVSEVQSALNAETLVQGESDPTSDYLVIAPIGSDAGQPYLIRFDSKAVVVRFDKTDQHLAAMRADPNVLILTGGRRPSEYLFDAARANGVPVLLSRTDTENTVIALEGIFDKTRFHGDRKLDRMSELLGGTGLVRALS